MSARFERIAVVGLGLLGGSVAGAARARGVAKRVVGVSRGRDTAAAAVSAGLADEGTSDLAAGVAGAELVVLCTPIFAMADTLRRASGQLAEGALVTDVGSVKGALVETLPGLLPPGAHYVGAHPMAGSHETGLRHASKGSVIGSSRESTVDAHGELSTRVIRGSRCRRRWRASGRSSRRTPRRARPTAPGRSGS